ncbi:unnamed protein product [Phaeothamnion confervicola]
MDTGEVAPDESTDAFVREATHYFRRRPVSSSPLAVPQSVGGPAPRPLGMAAPGGGSGERAAELHETDDINDLLARDLDIDVSHLAGLSATAKEFTPGGSVTGGGGLLFDGGGSAGGEEMDQGDDFGGGSGVMGGMDGDGGGDGVADAYYYPEDPNQMYDDGNGYYRDVLEEREPEDAMEMELEREMLELLGAVFSDCSEAALRIALERSEWDMDLACRGVAAALQKASDKNQKPCRHFLNGECLRRDCMFSHDFATTICRYWLQGLCRNGIRCAFLHEIDVDDEPSEEAEEDDITESLNLLEISEFPTLGAGSQGQLHSAAATQAPPSAAAMLVGSYGKSFAAVVATGSPQRAGGIGLGGAGPGSGVGGISGGVGSSLLTGAGASGWGSSGLTGTGGRRRVDARAYTGAAVWVATGQAVTAHYKMVREQAAELARARNKLFMGAQASYKRGDRRAAAELAKRGRELNDSMKAKHRVAANIIFASRNPRDQVLGRRMIDLHGLHVAEAQALLESELPALCRAGLDGVAVLTGTGHHSRGSNFRARLLPAVERLCQDWGLPFERVADRAGHVGVLHVALLPEVLLQPYGGAMGGGGVGMGGGGGGRMGGGVTAGAGEDGQRRVITIR